LAVRIGPSLMCCDLARVADEAAAMAADGADFLHIDVMDGHFVPNLTLGVDFVRSLSAATDLPQEIHLMVERPEMFVEAFAEAGAAACQFHVEPVRDPARIIDMIGAAGMRPGIALKPSTPLGSVEELLPEVEQALVMTVEPGFAGQSILAGSVERVRDLAGLVDVLGGRAEIKVDGGITPGAARELAAAGAGAVVAGSSSVFKGHRYVPGAVGELRRAVERP